MGRCKQCTYISDYPLSCKDNEAKWPFCGFKQKTKLDKEVDKFIERCKERNRYDDDVRTIL